MINSVLLITNAYPDFDSSYRGIFIKKMATLLQREGYKISVVTPKIYRGSRYVEEQQGIKIYRFPFFSGNRLLIEREKIPYFRMILYYLSGFLFTIFAMLKHRCTMIHSHWAIPTGLIGVFIGILTRKPLIVTIHGSDLRMAIERSGILLKLFIYVCRKATHLNCVSEVQKREMEQLGISDKKNSIIPMGVDDAFLERGKERINELRERSFTILSNRNLQPIYNVSLLIRAIPLVIREEPKVKFLIAGDGPERKNLENEANRLNVEEYVQFLGRIPHEEMPHLLGEADIYVSTSLYDGTSVSLLEAMASGAFPVVTDIPSNREWIIDGENGFLFPTDDEKYLARRIIEFNKNQSLLEESVKRNLLIIEKKVLWPVIIEKIKRMYHETLDLGTC
ncbi:MAG: glycosyltransferase [Thermodesulfobacteriota bacterium]|nr:glycosyltransferase [Thermodesulfobacteriota bacterium]